MRGRRPRDEKSLKEFANRFKDLIGDMALSKVADKLDRIVSQKTFWDYENGLSMPGPDVLRKLSEKFGVSVDWLLTGQESLFAKDEFERRYLMTLREAGELGVAETVERYARFVIEEKKKEVLL